MAWVRNGALVSNLLGLIRGIAIADFPIAPKARTMFPDS
jgi:hypothetical protein